MFALHETTQRRVCRIAFIALCIVPTALTLAAVAYCNRPWRHRDWQDELASQLHLRAELVDVTRPRPGMTVLSELRLADLESDQFFCSIDQLQLRHVDGRMMVDIGRLEIPAIQLTELWSAIATWLATGNEGEVELHIEQMTVAHATFPDWQLTDVSVRSERSETGAQRIVAVGKNMGDHTSETKLKVELALTDGQLQGTQLQCAIDARQISLPAWIVGSLVPGVQSCGASDFVGIIAVEQQERACSGTLRGNFAEVDLQQWVGPECPHRLQGSATVNFDELIWSVSRINNARGSVTIGSGAMSYSLFDNAQKLCGCLPGPAWDTPLPSPPETMVEFDDAALRFQLSTDGIAIAGQSVEGALIAKGHSPLVKLQQSEMTLPVGQLVRLLNYLEQPGWLPATRRAHDMADSLPLPGDKPGE